MVQLHGISTTVSGGGGGAVEREGLGARGGGVMGVCVEPLLWSINNGIV